MINTRLLSACMHTVHRIVSYKYFFTSSHRIDSYNGASVMASYHMLCSSIMYAVSLFYCFGVSAGDIQLPKENNGSSAPIPLSIPYRFFGTYESTLYLSQLLGCTSQVCRYACWNVNGIGTCCLALNTFYF